MADSDLLIGLAKDEPQVEVCRSFSYKHNAGNYESRDFFCSAKSTCPISQADDLSERLYYFCRAQVLKDVGNHIRDAREQQQKWNEPGRRTA